MNNLIITGNVSKVNENVVNDSKVLNFSVAVNSFYKNKSGEKVEKTTWFDCSLWNRESIYKFIKKGTHVTVSGSVEAKAWLDKDGNAQAVNVVLVDEVEFFNRDKSEEKE